VNALRAVLDAQSKNAHHEALRNARASVATPFLLDTVDFTQAGGDGDTGHLWLFWDLTGGYSCGKMGASRTNNNTGGNVAEITVREASQVTGYSRRQIARLARQERVTSRKIGNLVLVDQESLEQYIEKMKALGPDKYNWRR